MKRFLCIIMALSLFGGVLFAGGRKDTAAHNGKPNIVTTNFPPYDFVRTVAGDKVNLTMLLPPGTESHSFEPTPKDIITVQNANVFIYTGGETDIWVDRILASIDTSKIKIIRMMDTVDVVEEEIVEGMEDDEHAHEQDPAAFDPARVKDRPLNDFAGSWVSGVPFVNNGSLNAYISAHAKEKGETPEAVRTETLAAWTTDYENISVNANGLNIGGRSAAYNYNGYEIARGGEEAAVWYKYQINTAVSGFPAFIMFSDPGYGNEAEEHHEVPHFHLKYGNSDFASLIGRESWSPVYFAEGSSAEEILETLAGYGHGHEEEIAYDEHVWTSPKNAIRIVGAITGVLCEIDSANADLFRANAQSYSARLGELDTEFQAVVDGAKRKTFVFGDRFPFRYFADAYGLTYFAAFPGCSTETEPSAATVAFLIDKIRAEKIPVVFHIELSNERMADTIAGETGAQKLLFHAAHNISKRDFDRGLTFLEIQRGNVSRLKTALQ